MDTEKFIVCIKTDDIYRDIAEDNETRFDTSNYELDRQLVEWKNKKMIGVMIRKINQLEESWKNLLD